MDLKRPDTTSVDNFVFQGKFKCAEAQLASNGFQRRLGLQGLRAHLGCPPCSAA